MQKTIETSWKVLHQTIKNLEWNETNKIEYVLNNISVLENYLDFLLQPIYKPLDKLDNYLLYRIYERSASSWTINIKLLGERTHWVSLWDCFVQCNFFPVYPEEYVKPFAFNKHPQLYMCSPCEETLNLRIDILKENIAERLKKIHGHGYADIEIDWEEIEALKESPLEYYFEKTWLISIRITKKGYEYLKTTGYPMAIVRPEESKIFIDFIPPDLDIENLKCITLA